MRLLEIIVPLYTNISRSADVFIKRIKIINDQMKKKNEPMESQDLHHFTSVHFQNFKAFKDYWISLSKFNVMVGPNNSGKSTVLGAFRILAESMRRARARNPVIVPGPKREMWGHPVSLSEIPIATENVFCDYDDSHPAIVKFRLSNGNSLTLFFPEQGICYLIPESEEMEIRSVSHFDLEFNANIAFVPILGPVEHDEPLYQQEAARLALLTHRASRNFRNIWHHYPEDFGRFRNLILTTWPGMDIQPPEIDYSHKKPLLRMFCPEDRIPREIFWAGFGFQVWCQMLTYLVRGQDASMFMIDEPDIYLHSDLQRQLLGILKNFGPDILIATHSTEIISEVDTDDLIVINKQFKHGKRIKDPSELQQVFNVLGSNLNPTLTQLAKSKRAVFVEGKDFQILSRFARKLGKEQVANRTDFAVIPVEGFNPRKVRDFTKGVETTLGTQIFVGVIFDRDYRSDEEVNTVLRELKKSSVFARIHKRKELENFLLDPVPIKRAIEKRIAERNKRTGATGCFEENVADLLDRLTGSLRYKIEAMYLGRRQSFERSVHPEYDLATISESILAEFDTCWQNLETRLLIIPGKDVLSLLNRYLQKKYKVTLTATAIIDCFQPTKVPDEMVELIECLESFRKTLLEKKPRTTITQPHLFGKREKQR